MPEQSVASETAEAITTQTSAQTSETTTPTPEPTPSPTPEPVMLTSLEGFNPGDVIPAELIDTGNFSQYFTISEIQPGDAVYMLISTGATRWER